MYIPIRIILITVTLLLLSVACTPQLVKDDNNYPSAYGSSNDSGDKAPLERTEIPQDSSPELALKPVPIKREQVAIQQSVKALEKKPTPQPIATKPQTQVVTPVKVATMTKTAKSKPSLPDALKKSDIKPVRQNPPTTKDEPSVKKATLRDKKQVAELTKKAHASVTVQPATEPTKEPELDENSPETPAAPEPIENFQELAMLTRQTAPPEQTALNTPPVKITQLDMADLPLSFGAHWSLDRRPNPISQETQCLLASRSVNISDGYDRTDVQLLLTTDNLYVKTDSNIDLSYPETGIRFDDGSLLPFENLAKETTAEISDNVASLYKQMTPNHRILVRLGFWPTWPVTKTQQASFSLDGFSDGIHALRLCEQM